MKKDYNKLAEGIAALSNRDATRTGIIDPIRKYHESEEEKKELEDFLKSVWPKQQEYTYLIVGGGVAGFNAAMTIRKHDREGSLLIISDEGVPPIDRKRYIDRIRDGTIQNAVTDFPEDFAKEKIDLFIPDRDSETYKSWNYRGIKISSDYNYNRAVNAGKILFATGRTPVVSGVHYEGIPYANSVELNFRSMHTLWEMRLLEDGLDEDSRLAIVGGDLRAAFLLDTLIEREAEVHIFMIDPFFLRDYLPEEVSVKLQQQLGKSDIFIHPCEMPRRWHFERGAADILSGLESTKKEFYCSTDVLLNLGSMSNIEVSGQFDEDVFGDYIPVNEYMKVQDYPLYTAYSSRPVPSSEPEYYAAGDVVRYHHPIYQRDIETPFYDCAVHQGICAGLNMVGIKTVYDRLPFFSFRILDREFRFTGLFDPSNCMATGSYDQNSVAYYSFRENILEGYLGINRDQKEEEQAREFIRARMPRMDVKKILG